MNGCVYTACKQAHLHSHVASLGHSRCANRCAHVVTLYVASQGHCRTLSALPRGRAGHKLLANSHSHDAMRWHWDTPECPYHQVMMLGRCANRHSHATRGQCKDTHVHIQPHKGAGRGSMQTGMLSHHVAMLGHSTHANNCALTPTRHSEYNKHK